MNKGEKSIGFFSTIVSSIKMVMESGNRNNLLMTSIWLLTSVLFSITSLFEKYFYNAAEKLIDTDSTSYYLTGVKWLIIWCFITLFTLLIGFIVDKSSREMWNKVSYFIREKYMDKVAKINVSYFENMDTYNKISMTKNTISKDLSSVVQGSFNMIFSIISLITAVGVIVSDNWIIAVIVVIGTIPTVIVDNKNTREGFWQGIRNSHETRMQDYTKRVMLQHKFMKEIRFGNLFPYIMEKHEDATTKLYEVRKKLLHKYVFGIMIADVFRYATIMIALAIVTKEILDGKSSIGSFMLIYSCTQKMQSSFTKIFNNYILIVNKGRVVTYYNDIMGFEEENVREYGDTTMRYSTKQNIVEEKYLPEQFDEMEFKNISFSYPDTERIVIDNLSVKIRKGEKIAIIGENGSGKSTFVSLLCGLYKPDKGSVLLNGKPLSEKMEDLRSYISCAFQDFGQYEMSVADNIRIGCISDEISDEDVINAAKLSGAYEFIGKMKDGIHTHLGRLKKDGVANLSGGEWQKLAIARVLVKKSAEILILDEPTAALDPIAEAKLYENFSEICGEKTAILISHRLGATKLADRILVFDKGRIVEDGTHQELIEKNALYAKMYRAQAQWYV